MEKWEIKDRHYILSGIKQPLVFTVPGRHSRKRPLLWWDDKKGEQRELRYATNQISPFVDEQDGVATLEPIIFENGKLIVEDFNVNLQKFLFMHPDYDKIFFELDKEKNAKEDVDEMVSALDAQIMAKDLPIEELEAIARVVMKGSGVNVSNMTSSELRRDMIIWAKTNPGEFMDLVDDENLKLRNIAVRAVEMGVLHIKADNRTVVWSNNKKKKVIVAPFGENVYSALALFFKTDEGLDVLQKITNSL